MRKRWIVIIAAITSFVSSLLTGYVKNMASSEAEKIGIHLGVDQ